MGEVLSYAEALSEAMVKLAANERTRFIGQGVAFAGTTMTDTLDKVPRWQLLEFPVAEDLQIGFAIGLALQGYLPVCIYPRWNFLLLAANQLVNHLDRLPIYSGGGYCPKVIIRTAIPSIKPFDPGPQHDDDFTGAFASMLRTVRVVKIDEANRIVPAYQAAMHRRESTLLVEYTSLYHGRPSGVAA